MENNYVGLIGAIGMFSIALIILSMGVVTPLYSNQQFLDAIEEEFELQEKLINFDNKLRYECNVTLVNYYDENGLNEFLLYGFDEVKEFCDVSSIDYMAGSCVTKDHSKTVGINCGNYNEIAEDFALQEKSEVEDKNEKI